MSYMRYVSVCFNFIDQNWETVVYTLIFNVWTFYFYGVQRAQVNTFQIFRKKNYI